MLDDPNMQKSLTLATSVMGISEEDAMKSLEILLSPSMYTLQYIWGNVFLGTIVGLIFSLFIKKNNSKLNQ